MDEEQSPRMRKKAETESAKEASAPSFICPRPTESGQFDVFLSFSGLDTRKGFTDYLYHSLINVATVPICVFRDENSIPIGEEFGFQILDAITRSSISIPIISENYALSKWCLRELIHMMHCKERMSHIVLPIFYKVKPSDVRYLKGKFGAAFHSQKRFTEEDIQEGQQALTKVSDLHGWESEKVANGHEGELVNEVIKTVLNKLRGDFLLDVTKYLVGIDDHVKNIMDRVHTPASHARMIGIYGMGGIGKTTLAKVIYNELKNDFRHCSYLPDIRETAKSKKIHFLQNQLIQEIQPNERQVQTVDEGISLIKSRLKGKKVLILLDDVDCQNQLDALAREHEWFMAGSVIIVTTRYKTVLDQSEFKVDYNYELNKMDEVQSLLLFNRHAFRTDHSSRVFESISHDIISTMDGLPLALTVIGSYLYGKADEQVWKDVLKKLRKEPHGDVQNKLKISYDALDDGQREIFLDIACFFVGKESKFAMYMWEDCDFYPSQGIEELKQRCLIKIGDHGELRMHDQLRDLGRKIVCQTQPLEKRSRLWVYEEAVRVLTRKKGTEAIQAICLEKYSGSPQTYTNEQFKNLDNLRFLPLRQVALSGDFSELFPELRWLQWFDIVPDLTFSATNLHLPNLLVLQLSHNCITEHWGGWSSIMAARLRVLDLACCNYLRCTPDLSAFIELETLILEKCYRLEQLHSSIGKVKRLVFLDLSGCSSMKKLPQEVGELEELKELILDSSGILDFPLSIRSLKKLEKLSASGCGSLREVHPSIGKVKGLVFLNLNGCGNLRELPEEVGELEELKELILDSSGITEIPMSIRSLQKLEKLSARGCRSLIEIPNSIIDVSSLEILQITRGKTF